MQNSTFLQLRTGISRFVSLSDEEWEMLVPFLEERQLKKNDFFAKEGKVANEVALVTEGNMRHYYTRDGEEKTTYFYFEGHLVSA